MSQTREQQIREQVRNYHRDNPEVWELFKSFTLELIYSGRRNYSANAIFERIRWEKDLGNGSEAAFKLNNNYRAFYARRFMATYPQYEGFFRTRTQPSSTQDATYAKELGPQDYKSGYNETAAEIRIAEKEMAALGDEIDVIEIPSPNSSAERGLFHVFAFGKDLAKPLYRQVGRRQLTRRQEAVGFYNPEDNERVYTDWTRHYQWDHEEEQAREIVQARRSQRAAS